jgi:hypothetical protein
MPAQQFQVNLAAIGVQELVRSGQRILVASVLPPASGAPFNFSFDLGNNQVIGPVTTDGRLRIPKGGPSSDTKEGLKIVNAIAQPGVVVPILVAYDSGAPTPDDRNQSAQAADPQSMGIDFGR